MSRDIHDWRTRGPSSLIRESFCVDLGNGTTCFFDTRKEAEDVARWVYVAVMAALEDHHGCQLYELRCLRGYLERTLTAEPQQVGDRIREAIKTIDEALKDEEGK